MHKHLAAGRIGFLLQCKTAPYALAIALGVGATFGIHVKADALTIQGTDFRIDGVPVPGLAAPGDATTITSIREGVLTGLSADGSPFVLSLFNGDNLPTSFQLVQTAEPPPVPPIIDVPFDPAPQGLRPHQSLTLHAGGQLGQDFSAVHDSTVNIVGGSVGKNFEMAGADVNMSGGTAAHIKAYAESDITVSGGVVDNIWATFGGGVQLSGGRIKNATIYRESEIQISGGQLDSLSLQRAAHGEQTAGTISSLGVADASMHVSGGLVGIFSSSTVSELEFVGSNFRINDQPVAGLDVVGAVTQFQFPDDGVLSGQLADGTWMALLSSNFNRRVRGTVRLVQSAELPAGPSVIDIPTSPAPSGIGSGQTVIVRDGGALPAYFQAAPGSRIDVRGGTLQGTIRAANAEINLAGGAMPFGHGLAAYDSRVAISGGQFEGATSLKRSSLSLSGGFAGQLALVDSNFDFVGGAAKSLNLENSTLNFDDGDVEENLRASNRSVLNLDGGNVHGDVTLDDSKAVITAGSFGDINVRSGSVVEIQAGTASQVSAETHSTVNAYAGSFEASASSGGRVNIFGGTPSRASALEGGLVNIHGGELADGANADGGQVNIFGGVVGKLWNVRDDGVANIYSGSVGGMFVREATVNFYDGELTDFSMLHNGATLNMAGGEIVRSLAYVVAEAGSTFHLLGSQFSMNDQTIAGLNVVGDSVVLGAREFQILKTTFANGDFLSFPLAPTGGFPISQFNISPEATLRLTLVAPGMHPADFNGDGRVDSGDVTQWTGDLALNADSDANGDGRSDGLDFLAWQQQVGTLPSALAAMATVPEPATALPLAWLAIVAITWSSARRGTAGA